MSRLHGCTYCALALSLALAGNAPHGWAQEGPITFGSTKRIHEPVYDDVPASYTDSPGLGYWGPVSCGANSSAGCSESSGGDCGCGGCDGSCGCGLGMCNCGSGDGSAGCNCGSGCNCSDGECGCTDLGCGSGECGCGPCDMGCSVCDGYCSGDCDVPCECSPQPCGPRLTMFGDFLYLQVTDADVAFSQQQDGLGGAGTVPFGEIGTIGQDFNPGFRVGGSVACGPCTGVVVSFTHFESDSYTSLDPPTGTSTGAVGSLVHHPGAAVTASVGPVDATYDVDFQLADAVWRKVLKQTCRYSLAISCGVEYGHLEQDFTQSGIFGGGSGGAIDTATSINFDGGGIKFGVDGDHEFGHGLGIYGHLTAAALAGRFTSHYSMFNQSTDQMLAMADWTDDRVIGQIEYEVGMSLTSMNGHWRAAAGYMFSYWTNTVTTPDFIDAVQADNYTNVGDTLGFNGLVGRVECRW